jgi:uncharacterized SAM-binding protein YcdF (DUF218 family)
MTYIEPLVTFCLLICFVVWTGIRKDKHRKAILGLGLLGLFLLSWPPAEWLFSRPLESAYPIRPFSATAKPQAIVVLNAGYSLPQYERPYAIPTIGTLQNCAMAAWIYQQNGPVPVLGCEGAHRFRFAPVLRGLLLKGGVPDPMIWIEDRSRDTHENATFGSAILRQHGIGQIVLVTDAQSMPRAAACFRKQGIAVTPAPSEFGQLDFTADDLMPNWRAIRRNERTLHETLGLAWYSLRGWI